MTPRRTKPIVFDGLRAGLRMFRWVMHPPRHIIADFRDVQSAQIDVETKKREAEGFASREIPKAQAELNGLIQAAAR